MVFENECLRLAALILGGADFAVEALPIHDRQTVIAENPLFVVSVDACATIDDALTWEAEIPLRLTEFISSKHPGGKAWDVYAVCLITQGIGNVNDSVEKLFGINYDTSYLRRMAHAGVEPTVASVRSALCTFLPLVEMADSNALLDPLAEIENELVQLGVERNLVTRAVQSYRSSGGLDSV